MLKTKIFQVYTNLDSIEINRFEKFVKSNNTFSGRDFSSILGSLREAVKNGFFNGSEDVSFRFIAGKTGLKKSTLQSRLSELYKLSESFTLLLYLDKNKIPRMLYLLDSYLNTKNYRLFDYVFNSFVKDLDNQKTNHKTLQIYFELYTKAYVRAFHGGNFKEYEQYFKLSEEFGFASFILEYLFNIIDSANKKKYGGKDIDPAQDIVNIPKAAEKIFKTVSINSKLQGFIRTVYSFYKLYTEEESKENLRSAIQVFKKHRNETEEQENYELFLLLINYCIIQLNNGAKGYLQELFSIIKEKVDAGYTKDLTQQNIPVNQFKDYVQIALKAGEIKWAHNFVKNYSHLLPATIRFNMTNITLGLIALYENKTEEALSFYNKIKHTNYIDFLSSGIGKTSCFFRLGMHIECIEQIKSIKNYLKYHEEIPAAFTKRFLNTALIYSLLVKYKESGINKKDLSYRIKKLNNQYTDTLKKDLADLNINV